jgi:hypothetical protein
LILTIICILFQRTLLERIGKAGEVETINVAEASRPYRKFTEQAREDNKLSGRKRKEINAPTEAQRVNWFSPVLWAQIRDVARRTRSGGITMSQAAIQRELVRRNPVIFARLTQQVLGRWIDRSGETDEWSAETLEKVACENRQGGVTGRIGVMVCTLSWLWHFPQILMNTTPRHHIRLWQHVSLNDWKIIE